MPRHSHNNHHQTFGRVAVRNEAGTRAGRRTAALVLLVAAIMAGAAGAHAMTPAAGTASRAARVSPAADCSAYFDAAFAAQDNFNAAVAAYAASGSGDLITVITSAASVYFAGNALDNAMSQLSACLAS